MEGSELMPYVLLANVKRVKTGKPFLEDMARFGFLPDARSAANPYGMPVGLTVGPSRNASAQGMEMAGFSCAACHVGELTYHGKRMRIDGAPGLIDLQAHQMEFQQSLDATLKDPRALLALVVAMERRQNSTGTPSGAAAGLRRECRLPARIALLPPGARAWSLPRPPELRARPGGW